MDSPKYIVINERNQPVELHFESQVRVLPAHGHMELDETQLALPQLQALVTRSLLSVREVSEPASDTGATSAPETEGEEPQAKGRVKKKARRKTG